MNISAPFIRRRIGTVLLTAAIALAGTVAYLQLPVAPLPQVDFPTITVGAGLPGASPEIMASAVAGPLERELGHIAGVNEMTSGSNLGTTSITLQFDLNRNIDGAAREFRFREIFQIVTPVTETTAERKRQVNLVQQLKLRHERIQNLPWIAELGLGPGVRGPGSGDFTARTKGTEGEKRIRHDERIARLGGVEGRASQQNNSRPAAQFFHERFRRVCGGDFLDQRAHLYHQVNAWGSTPG